MTSTAGTRERLLKTAAELFYREGVHAVGVERLCQQAGVSKRSMYQLFDTKDELVAQSLREYGPASVSGYLPDRGAALTPRGRILYVFERLREQAARPEFAGCPFVNTAVELRSAEHPGAVVAREFKQRLTGFFERTARAAGVAQPRLLAGQLTVAFDGAAVWAVMHPGDSGAVITATPAALLDAAGLVDPPA